MLFGTVEPTAKCMTKYSVRAFCGVLVLLGIDETTAITKRHQKAPKAPKSRGGDWGGVYTKYYDTVLKPNCTKEQCRCFMMLFGTVEPSAKCTIKHSIHAFWRFLLLCGIDVTNAAMKSTKNHEKQQKHEGGGGRLGRCTRNTVTQC